MDVPFSVRSALAVVAAGLLAGCGTSGASVPRSAATAASSPSAPVRPSSIDPAKIKHVIVVLYENRSFDDLLQFYNATNPAGATGAGHTADIGTFGYDHLGNKVPLVARSFTEATDSDHSHHGFLTQFDGGKNDGWDLTSESATNPDYPYQYLPQSEVQPYLDIAHEGAISDRYFHGVQGPTWPSHIEIGASSTLGIVDNPSDTTWGCDAPPGTTSGVVNPDGSVNEAGPFPCLDRLSIFDLLDRKGVSWKYDSEPEGQSVVGELVIPSYFRQLRFGSDWNTKIATSDAQILTDLAGTALPQVSYVIPNESSTDHPGTPSAGPTYLETLFNAFGRSAYYDDTLMIVTWDDWGGLYDHVVPKALDALSLSYRKPLLILGGYAKQNYVSHADTEDSSINATLEELFGLGTLGQHDLRAAPFDDLVDTASPPRPFTAVTSAETISPTSAAANFRLFPAAILGKHDYIPYVVHGRDRDLPDS